MYNKHVNNKYMINLLKQNFFLIANIFLKLINFKIGQNSSVKN